REGIDIPIVAIGGITSADIPAIMATGVSGIALSGTVLSALDPSAEMARLLSLL
ncbi:MAG: thiamine phosphate synthase, partial [Bacteroidales bacterium]|nr:thiamine phosphate synthase [Bacteroidales bacterium]